MLASRTSIMSSTANGTQERLQWASSQTTSRQMSGPRSNAYLARRVQQTSARMANSEQALAAMSRRSSGASAPLEEGQAASPPSSTDAVEALDEYSETRGKLLSRAKKGSAAIALYIFLQQGITAMSCSLLGSIAGFYYLKSLVQSVESYTEDSEVPIVRAREVESQPWRALSIIWAIYSQALSPRLLIPTSLAAGVAAFNATQPQSFSVLQEFDILLGFLFSFKAGLILALYDDIKPKARLDQDERPERPVLAALADPDIERKERLLRDRVHR